MLTKTKKPIGELPIGAQVVHGAGVRFRVWAPACQRIDVVPEGGDPFPLARETGGYFSGLRPGAVAGMRYRFRLDSGDLCPDPASRFQPEGPHGPSEVVDPSVFQWSDEAWRGIDIRGQVIYEIHVGTFTREGTWDGAIRELPQLADLGVTAIEVMPVAEFPGNFGWGYDGVDLFAPTRLYGRPDDFRRFVDRAHSVGLAVILDVVYNHFGPDGNYVSRYSADYFTDRFKTDWGTAINFDGYNSGPVREFITANAAYWISEFHLDGLRLDATQNIYDASEDHIIAALTRAARQAAGQRSIIVVGENERQEVRLVQPVANGGFGLDALWNDDFHHSAIVAMTGKAGAYYTDYRGAPQEFISAAKYGYLYQGQWYKWQKQRRGTPGLALPPSALINFIQNHDQIANSAHGRRIQDETTPGRLRAMTALLLLAPGTPMLFQGQEFGASSRFLFFADHQGALAEQVKAGRREFLAQWPSLRDPEMIGTFADPSDPETFHGSKLNHSEREAQSALYSLHRDLLRLRRLDPVFRSQKRGGVDGAVLGPEAFVLRFFSDDLQSDRLLLVNLGRDLHLDPTPEPLLAPPESAMWEILWSSEDPKYGGIGTAPLDSEENWRLPGHAAVALRPAPLTDSDSVE